MALFALSDLHLSFGTDKPMDVFGSQWGNYEERMQANWNSLVSPDDVVIVNGDVSWAMYLENAVQDFDYINRLNGTKLISKGNHDYWWSTLNKNTQFCMDNGFSTIRFLHNNCYVYEGAYGRAAICGTRGWQLTSRDDEDMKIYNRELLRFESSIQLACKEKPDVLIAALHYPPDEQFTQLIHKYNIPICLFGHLHSHAGKHAKTGVIDSVDYRLTACDCLDFTPIKILD